MKLKGFLFLMPEKAKRHAADELAGKKVVATPETPVYDFTSSP